MTHTPPPGLTACPVCGEYRGTTTAHGPYYDGATVTVLCLCDGIPRPRCGHNRIHRPISDRYDTETGTVLHVPWFTGIAGCHACRHPQPDVITLYKQRDEDDPTFLQPRRRPRGDARG